MFEKYQNIKEIEDDLDNLFLAPPQEDQETISITDVRSIALKKYDNITKKCKKNLSLKLKEKSPSTAYINSLSFYINGMIKGEIEIFLGLGMEYRATMLDNEMYSKIYVTDLRSIDFDHNERENVEKAKPSIDKIVEETLKKYYEDYKMLNKNIENEESITLKSSNSNFKVRIDSDKISIKDKNARLLTYEFGITPDTKDNKRVCFNSSDLYDYYEDLIVNDKKLFPERVRVNINDLPLWIKKDLKIINNKEKSSNKVYYKSKKKITEK